MKDRTPVEFTMKLRTLLAGTMMLGAFAAAVAIAAPTSAASASQSGALIPHSNGLIPPNQLMKYARWVTINGRRQLVAPVSYAAARRHLAYWGIPWGTLRNAGSGLCLSSYPDIVARGATQQRCNGSANQHWVYSIAPAGYELENGGMTVRAGGSVTQGCLDNRGGVVYRNGNQQIMWPCEYDGWNMGLDYHQGFAQRSGTVLIHTNGWGSSGGKIWCVTSLGNKNPGSSLVEWVCNKYSINQSFYGSVGTQ